MRLGRTTGFAGGLTLLLAFGPAAAGQSLGEAARKEKERRQKAGPTGPAFTDDDLRGYAEGGPAAKGAARGPDKSTAGEKGSADPVDATRWVNRYTVHPCASNARHK